MGGLWGQAWEDHTCTLCPVNTDFLVQEGILVVWKLGVAMRSLSKPADF